MLSITQIAHVLLRSLIPQGALAVDATAGNGHDTLFLAQCCGPGGQVQAFDLQARAVDATIARLRLSRETDSALAACQVRQASHADLRDLLPEEWRGRIAAVLFNLGYLPGGDKSVITRPESTLAALAAATEFLAPGGVLSVVTYPGHPGGESEGRQILDWVSTLDSRRWEALQTASLQRADSPYLILLRRRAQLSSLAGKRPIPRP